MYLIKHGIQVLYRSTDLAVAKGIAVQHAQHGQTVSIYLGNKKLETLPGYTAEEKKALHVPIHDMPEKKPTAKKKAEVKPVASKADTMIVTELKTDSPTVIPPPSTIEVRVQLGNQLTEEHITVLAILIKSIQFNNRMIGDTLVFRSIDK